MNAVGRHADGRRYDAIVVGSGVIGSLVAKRLGERGWRVLVLEAGTGQLGTREGYAEAVDDFRAAFRKTPNSPYLSNPAAPSPDAARPHDYFVQDPAGQLYTGDYLRALGGTANWEGETPRMLLSDLTTQSAYGVGRDWFPPSWDDEGDPAGELSDLYAYYTQAERELGVSGDAARVWAALPDDTLIPDRHQFPMLEIPQSHLDRTVAARLTGHAETTGDHNGHAAGGGDPARIRLNAEGGISRSTGSARPGERDHDLTLTPIPQARNSTPNPDYAPDAAYRPRGATGRPDYGERCAGNSSCDPICPAQAKYTALRTHREFDPDLVTVATHSVVSRVIVNRNGRATGVEYKVYDDPRSRAATKHRAEADVVVLAAHAIENAKIMLMSGLRNDGIGRYLMDHPLVPLHGLAGGTTGVGPFRGPPITSAFESFRSGDWRDKAAAFRIGVVNRGWSHRGDSPARQVRELLTYGGLRGLDPDHPPADPGRWRPVFGRELRARLADHLPRQFELRLMLEQPAYASNRVTLDWRRLDRLGNPRPRITYRLDDHNGYVEKGIRNAVRIGQEVFRRINATEWHFSDGAEDTGAAITQVPVDGRMYDVFGARHSAGTHVMGRSAQDSVVDLYQRSHEHPNLYAVGSGSMPSMGTADPTLTAAAWALRSADQMHRELVEMRRPYVMGGRHRDRTAAPHSEKVDA